MNLKSEEVLAQYSVHKLSKNHWTREWVKPPPPHHDKVNQNQRVYYLCKNYVESPLNFLSYLAICSFKCCFKIRKRRTLIFRFSFLGSFELLMLIFCTRTLNFLITQNLQDKIRQCEIYLCTLCEQTFKGTDQLCKVVKLSMHCCGQIL